MKFFLYPLVPWIGDRELRRLAAGCAITGAATAADWQKGAVSVAVVERASEIPDEGIPVVLAATIDVPGDLAYHTRLDGRPYCLVLAAQEEVKLSGIQRATCHEIDETIVDPDVQLWRPMPRGGSIAVEIDDPVQGDVLSVDLGEGELLSMSNHVLPLWFDAGAPIGAKLDAKWLCTKPLVVRPGGYAITLTDDGALREIGEGPAAYKRHPAFRHGRRLASAPRWAS